MFEKSPSAKLVTIPLLGFLVLLGAKFVFLAEWGFFTYLWRAVVLLGFVGIGYMYLSRVTTRYRVNPLEASICKGILSKSTKSAPVNRITNMEIRRPLYKRLFGLADLYIDTPGSSDVELKMTEMNKSDAEAFRSFLSNQMAQQKIVEAGDNESLRKAREQALSATS